MACRNGENSMNTTAINREWNFIVKETTSSNKGGTEKGTILFWLQILLSALSRTKNPREKQMLASIYQKYRGQYRKAH